MAQYMLSDQGVTLQDFPRGIKTQEDRERWEVCYMELDKPQATDKMSKNWIHTRDILGSIKENLTLFTNTEVNMQ